MLKIIATTSLKSISQYARMLNCDLTCRVAFPESYCHLAEARCQHTRCERSVEGWLALHVTQ